ncbi:MAG: hypothetical protein LUQ65_13805 [Candidatus Helarchaeota archaeon]|nr:hypothetical protein [Candidatus Helarchaeota archaeon]
MNSISERGDLIESVIDGQTPSLNIRNEGRSNHRNLSPLLEELSSLGLRITPNENSLTIQKEYGTYRIDLRDGSVGFTPFFCEKCWTYVTCRFTRKKLCIIEVSQGWVNFPLLEVDLFILSVAFAIVYDLLPDKLLEQIRKFSLCEFLVPHDIVIKDYFPQWLKEFLDSVKNHLTYLPKAPPIQGPVPPPK